MSQPALLVTRDDQPLFYFITPPKPGAALKINNDAHRRGLLKVIAAFNSPTPPEEGRLVLTGEEWDAGTVDTFTALAR